MPRSATIFARVEPEVKEQAERIYTELGVSMSNALEIFLRASIREQGFPFAVNLSRPGFKEVKSREDIDTALREGFDSLEQHGAIPAAQVKDHLRAKYGLDNL